MAFIPKTWVDDQIVYAADMNRIEQGIAETDTLLQTKVNTADFQSHTANKSNPHGVTAVQTGAYSKGETDTLLSSKLNKAGDTMTNTLQITTDGNPGIILFGNQYGAFMQSNDGYLFLSGDGRALGNRLILHDNATNKDYPIYGVHNGPYVTGTYTGTCASTENTAQTIALGFKPKAVLIATQDGRMGFSYNSHSNTYGGLILDGYPIKYNSGTAGGEIVSNGFAVKNVIVGDSNYLSLNSLNETYHYIAFR